MSEQTETKPTRPAPRGRVEGDWWLSPISECCGYLMEWEAEEEIALIREWHGNPNDGEPDKLRCLKCGKVTWQDDQRKES